VVFALGGAADLGWHQVFGIEGGVDALVSPSHLILFAGGMLILTSPLAVGLVGPGRTHRPGAGVGAGARRRRAGACWATALAAFFLGYAVVFAATDATGTLTTIPEGQPGHEQAEMPTVLGLARYLVSTALLVLPLLLLYRRGPVRFGAATALVGAVAWLSAAIVDLPAAVVGGAATVTLAALVADVLLVRLDGGADRPPAAGSSWPARCCRPCCGRVT
jgi:hypothetical protein